MRLPGGRELQNLMSSYAAREGNGMVISEKFLVFQGQKINDILMSQPLNNVLALYHEKRMCCKVLWVASDQRKCNKINNT